MQRCPQSTYSYMLTFMSHNSVYSHVNIDIYLLYTVCKHQKQYCIYKKNVPTYFYKIYTKNPGIRDVYSAIYLPSQTKQYKYTCRLCLLFDVIIYASESIWAHNNAHVLRTSQLQPATFSSQMTAGGTALKL